jgi:DNA helicase-2/ATP-dependent DNA helicase PcrA
MWHAVDELTNSTTLDNVERVVVRKVGDFVKMIRELAAMRSQMSVTDFGKEVMARSGILHMLEADKKPENETSKDYLDQLLSMMSAYEEECAKDVEEGLRDSDYEPSIDEWMQNIMLQTDQDNEDDGNRVTLMTVHSAKGLEFDYIYIVGMEEGLFPSSRSVESLADLEEERRLFYVALTRAKKAAMLSFAEMRRVWGKTESTMPSRFLKEIDKQYLKSNFNIEELHGRNRWERAAVDDDDDIFGRREQRPQQRYDTRRGEVPMRNFGGGSAQPRPQVVTTPPIDPQRAGMRSVGTRQSGSGAVTSAGGALGGCAYSIGERVSHPKFGGGVIERIEPLATDHKVVINFDSYGTKTLLANYAKLTKL